MWIFPEGTRNKKRDSLLPFKRGAFRVAITCKVPIIPVVFSPYYFINDEKKVIGRGNKTIKFNIFVYYYVIFYFYYL